MAHQIRLRAAWQRTLGSETIRVSLPDACPVGQDVGTYVRSFNAPTGIDNQTRIELVLESWSGKLTLFLDDSMLVANLVSQAEALRVSLSGKLTAYHKLTLVLSDLGAGISLTGPCYLLIE